MHSTTDTQAIFRQLAASAAPGALAVKAIIENHDACCHAAAVDGSFRGLTQIHNARIPRPPAIAARIARQNAALAPLVTRLPHRCLTAV